MHCKNRGKSDTIFPITAFNAASSRSFGSVKDSKMSGWMMCVCARPDAECGKTEKRHFVSLCVILCWFARLNCVSLFSCCPLCVRVCSQSFVLRSDFFCWVLLLAFCVLFWFIFGVIGFVFYWIFSPKSLYSDLIMYPKKVS